MERSDARSLWNSNVPAWTALSRAGFDVYRDLVNMPAFLDMLPTVDGLIGMDVGCGEGHHARLLAASGATAIGVDISEVFLADAARSGGGALLAHADGARLPFRADSFDFVTAVMSLMDMADPEATLHEIGRALRPGGFLQFSVIHPVSTTPTREWIDDDDGHRRALAIGDYFSEGSSTERWTFGSAPADVLARHEPFTITYARRTLTGWIRAVLDAGLIIEAIDEPFADEATARVHPEVADTRIAPYFLILRARKPDR